MTDISCYRKILEDEYLKRLKLNQNFSQRAFAKLLKLSSAHLNALMTGKRGLSPMKAEQIAIKLGFSKHEIEHFVDLANIKYKFSKIKNEAQSRIDKRKAKSVQAIISEEKFKIISDWYHFAILELTYLENFEFNKTNVAKVLKITEIEAERAIARLIQVNLLKFENGKYTAIEESSFTMDDIPSSAIKKFHHQILQKALAALVSQSTENRDFTSTVIAIDSDKIKDAKEDIRNFSDEFIKKYGFSKNKKNVYAVNTQIFKLND